MKIHGQFHRSVKINFNKSAICLPIHFKVFCPVIQWSSMQIIDKRIFILRMHLGRKNGKEEMSFRGEEKNMLEYLFYTLMKKL